MQIFLKQNFSLYFFPSLHCRQNNTQVLNFMHGILNITDAKLLEAFYLSKIFEIVESHTTSRKNYAGTVGLFLCLRSV